MFENNAVNKLPHRISAHEDTQYTGDYLPGQFPGSEHLQAGHKLDGKQGRKDQQQAGPGNQNRIDSHAA